MISPFPHHGPLEADQVHGRDDLVSDLVQRVTRRSVTALLGPRRFGKTSVLRKVASELEPGGSVIWLDLFEVTSMLDIALRLDRALAEASGPAGKAASRYATTLGVNLGMLHVEISRPAAPNVTGTLHSLLDTLVSSALSAPTVVIIDEFSSIDRVDGAAGLLRTKLQHHFQSIGLLLAGSEPSTMKAMFSLREQPFYGQADILTIGPLACSDVHAMIGDGFTTTDRDPGRVATLLHQFCGGHPRRTMQFADAAWYRSEPGASWSDDSWIDALDHVRQATSDASEAQFSGLSRSDQSVMRVVASGGSVWGSAAARLGLNPSPAKAALRRLIDAGHIIEVDGKPEAVDPVFADWIRRTIPV